MAENMLARITRMLVMDYEEQADHQVARTVTKIRGTAQIAKGAVIEVTDLHVVGAEEGARLYMAEKFYTEQLKAIGVPEGEFKLALGLYRHNGIARIAQLMAYGSENIADEAERGI
jgi:hypothetical protein